MTSRERFLACMNYQPVDRVPLRPTFGAWPETLERWANEGSNEPNAPTFQTDQWDWFGGWFFPNPPFEREVVEEDAETILYINKEGILMRELKNHPHSSMPQFVRFPVQTRDDFRRFWKERMNPDIAARVGADWKEKLSAYRERDVPLIIIADRWGGFFGPIRNMTGVEHLCTLFYDEPALVEEMMDATADFIIAMMDQILDVTDIDVFGFWEDMAYKTASLLSPEMARKYMLPRYRRVVDFVRSRGVELISLDSDGDVSDLIPVWLDAGINVLYPFEAQAGMDVLEVRKEYGRDLRMWYGVDKRVLASGKEAIDAELERIRPLVEDGGYVPGTDHSLPPDVSYENYCYYMERFLDIYGS
ncbi:MAG: uroporphyrinogen decarboxylase family protein [Planctomycetota bacterium]|jgi:uroporphyrinogen decarboxylase|nr:uroporphyrinogen decarboxylase family protein [Planctomycetota bacterium]MDP7254215.1 uroporphyrinogen decarboxylase family protein [Planctomycetota bacterium]